MLHRLGILLLCLSSTLLASDRLPNIVYLMSDELAYYELGHMGNPYIRTPHIDQFAAQGIRFTQALAGSPVCAPLRCNLMTGKHAGHASVRANDGGTPLRAGEATIASILKERGYATGGFGKWGCGGRDSTGVPEAHGFDVFFGYYDQVHAHSFYPPYLIRNSEEVSLKGNEGGRNGETYSHYEIMKQALGFIRKNKDRPFFCYLPITPPHGMYDIPETDPAWERYRNAAWMKEEGLSQDIKNYAAMVSMVDNDLGTVLNLLRELKLEDNTIVFFTGDNGGQDRFRSPEHPRGFFGPNVNPLTGEAFRGGKGNLYEGGLRIPFLVRWPGHIEPGSTSDHLFYHPDLLPTLAEITGATPPQEIDGLSILPTLLGEKAAGRAQAMHPMLYWEFGQQVAVRKGMWKAIRPKAKSPWELYNLSQDLSENRSVAHEHTELLESMKAFAQASHTPIDKGVYEDPQRTKHERDRWAKWGNSRGSTAPASKAHAFQTNGTVPQESLSVVAFSSQNSGNGKWAHQAIDGRSDTLWHTRFGDRLAAHPHTLVIDLGKKRDIEGFVYLARQDGGWNGTFAQTEFYLSESKASFPSKPAHIATFGKTRKEQVARLDRPARARYVQVKVLSEVNRGPWASAAELAIIGGKE